MFDMLKRLYENGKLTDNGLSAAVTRGWLTQAQADAIIHDGK